MFQVIYGFLIQPLEVLLELVLTGCYSLTGSYGLSILLMSGAVSILIAPFFALADSWQKEEQTVLLRMKKKREDIKAVFKGDEQYFYIRTLHRQNGYSPLMAIRSSFGLLIQIPFFIGAYRFLSAYTPLQGESFLFLKDLAAPDTLLGFVNIMPFVMTALNLASAFVFAGDQSRRGRFQLYGMAVLFLVLLYNSPSGLLLYWSCNNLISLLKNLAGKYNLSGALKRIPPVTDKLFRRICFPRIILLGFLFYTLGAVALYYLSKSGLTILLVKISYPVMLYLALTATLFFLSRYKKGFYSHILLLILLALWAQAVSYMITGPFSMDLKDLIMNLILIGIAGLVPTLFDAFGMLLEKRNCIGDKEYRRTLGLTLLIAVFMAGLLIPSSLVASSPTEMGLSGALLFRVFLWALFSLSLMPLFLVSVAPQGWRRPFLFILVSLIFTALVNFLFFPGNYGVISESLQFEFGKAVDPKMQILVNLGVAGLSALLILLLILKGWINHIRTFLTVVLLALVILSGMNMTKISGGERKQSLSDAPAEPVKGRIPLSKDQNNTIILFSDRALAGAVTAALEAYPDLKQEYDGFTWYPDTLSFGVNTITTLPAMLGGYEYDPKGMIAREDMSLKEKVREGLMVLPEIFLEKGSSVYVSIPLHKGFGLSPEDLDTLGKENALYEDLKELYAGTWFKEQGIPADFGEFLSRDKSLFMFSLFRMAPKYFRNELYDEGFWHSMNRKDPRYQEFDNLHNAISFLEEWAVLDYLPKLCRTDATGPTFAIIGNKASHEVLGVGSNFQPSAAKIDYPQEDLERFGSVASAAHIYTNVAVLEKITHWLDWMKAEGVYDNTQIVIVADHGRAGEDVYDSFFQNVPRGEGKPEYVGFHPLLMFKPFDSRGELEISDKFMTNADTASLVLEAFGGADNPFTGQPLDQKAKEKPLLIGDGANLIYKHARNAYSYDKQYYVSGSMLNPENWSAAE